MSNAVIDLFCGIGGLTKGLELSGLNVVAGIDIDKSCRFAYEHNNRAKFIYGDVGYKIPMYLILGSLQHYGLLVHLDGLIILTY